LAFAMAELAAPASDSSGRSPGVFRRATRPSHLFARIDRSELDPAVGAGLDLDVRPEADGGVDRAAPS